MTKFEEWKSGKKCLFFLDCPYDEGFDCFFLTEVKSATIIPFDEAGKTEVMNDLEKMFAEFVRDTKEQNWITSAFSHLNFCKAVETCGICVKHEEEDEDEEGFTTEKFYIGADKEPRIEIVSRPRSTWC